MAVPNRRILFYTDTPIMGGAENQMLLLAKFLPSDKFSVTLVCSGYKNLNGWCQDFMETGANVVRLKVFHKHDPRHFFYLRKILPEFDLLHMHIWNPASCRYGFIAATKTPLVITEHDPFAMKGLKGFLKRKFLKKVSAIIVASKAAKKLVLDQDADLESKIRIIYNGIDIPEWNRQKNVDERNEFRRAHFHALPNEKVILCAAELHKRKGQKYLIEAAKNLIVSYPDLKFVFAGDGPEKKHYEKLARPLGNRVVFLGRRRDIEKVMAASDFFVLPSAREAFGLVVIEAAIIGLPTVASEIGGLCEIVENGKTGLLAKPENTESLEKAIGYLMENPNKANEFKEAAKERVSKLFDAREMALLTARIYDEVLSRSSADSI